TADGRLITIRASRAGIAIPGVAASTANIAAAAFFLSPSLHDIATRNWLLVRDDFIRAGGTNGVRFRSPMLDKLDLGTYNRGWGALTYSFGLAAAQEMGDGEAVQRIQASLAEVAPLDLNDGVGAYPASSTANTMMAPGELGGEHAFHDLLAYGVPDEQRSWPC